MSKTKKADEPKAADLIIPELPASCWGAFGSLVNLIGRKIVDESCHLVLNIKMEKHLKESYLKDVAGRKVSIDHLADDLNNQITSKAQQIRANAASPDISQWQKEMSLLQKRLGTEPEAKTHSLCDEIQKKTGSIEVSKRNTEATNRGLKGEAWAKFVLDME